MKYPRIFQEFFLTICKMRKVVMQTEEPVYTRDSNERVVKIINSNYDK